MPILMNYVEAVNEKGEEIAKIDIFSDKEKIISENIAKYEYIDKAVELTKAVDPVAYYEEFAYKDNKKTKPDILVNIYPTFNDEKE